MYIIMTDFTRYVIPRILIVYLYQYPSSSIAIVGFLLYITKEKQYSSF